MRRGIRRGQRESGDFLQRVRRCEWDIRAGTIELAILKLRPGSSCPKRLLERRRRAEPVVAASYLLGASTRRVEKLAESLVVTRLMVNRSAP